MQLSALVIGAMTPDFHYFLGLHRLARTSHSVAGAFYFCLPIALATLWLFHSVVKLPLIALTPDPFKTRLTVFAVPLRFRPVSRCAMILLALLTGIFSHLLWDSFTHGRGWVVQHYPPFRAVIFSQFRGGLPAFYYLQYGSTLIGIVVLAVACWRWAKNATAQPTDARLVLEPPMLRKVLAGLAGSACLVAGLYAFLQYGHLRMKVIAAHAAILFVIASLCGVFVYSLWWHLARSRANTSPCPDG
jgi:hypothetical protein